MAHNLHTETRSTGERHEADPLVRPAALAVCVCHVSYCTVRAAGVAVKTFLTAIFAALWLVDAAATISFVSAHGSSAEANPFMRALIDSTGLGGFALVKAGVLAFWLSIHKHAHLWIHYALAAVMVPVSIAAFMVAWGL